VIQLFEIARKARRTLGIPLEAIKAGRTVMLTCIFRRLDCCDTSNQKKIEEGE
jgi:hypothetical protein